MTMAAGDYLTRAGCAFILYAALWAVIIFCIGMTFGWLVLE